MYENCCSYTKEDWKIPVKDANAIQQLTATELEFHGS